MSKRSMMLRLIDVVLILLFGFISISEVSDKSEVVLPTSSMTPVTPPDREELLIVAIAENGDYLVEHEQKRLPSQRDLYAYLLRARNEAQSRGAAVRVRVRPHKSTPIKYTMAVAAICDNLRVPKGLDVRRIRNR